MLLLDNRTLDCWAVVHLKAPMGKICKPISIIIAQDGCIQQEQ